MKKIYFLFFMLTYISATAQKQPIQLSWLNSAQLYYNGGWLTMESIAACSDGSVVASGILTGSADFDPGPDTFMLSTRFVSSLDTHDAFVAKYSKKGDLIFAINTEDSSEYSGADAKAIAVDANDNIYITGSFSGSIRFKSHTQPVILRSASDCRDNFLACYDKNGKLKFAENITHVDGNRKYSDAYSLVVDKNRNVYVAGDFMGAKVDFDPGAGSVLKTSQGKDIFFSKYDSLGNLVLVKTIGGFDDEYASKIAVDNNGDILLCGNFSSSTIDFDPNASEQILTLKGKTDLFFAKYDSLGNYVFAKNVGKIKSDYATGLAISEDNNFVITGSFIGKLVDFDPGNDSMHLLSTVSSTEDAFIAKYNAAGNCILAFSLTSKTDGHSSGTDITCDSIGNIFTIGNFSGNNVDFDPGSDSFFIKRAGVNHDYISKYDSAGNLLFAEAIGNYNYYTNTGSEINCIRIRGAQIIITGDYNHSLDVDPGKDSTILKSASSTSYVSKYDERSGNYLSSISTETYAFYYNSNTTVTASATDTKGNVYVCGTFNGRFDFDPGPGVYILESLADYRSSMFFAKYTSAGNLVFAKAIITESQFNDIAIDKEENIYLTGAAEGNTDFDPSDSVQYIDNGDTSGKRIDYGFFIAKYSADGNLIFVKGGGNNRNNYDYELNFNAIALDDDKNIYLSGSFPYNLDFDPSINTHILNGYGGSIFYAKYDSSGNFIFAYRLGDDNSGGRVYDLKLNSKGNIIITGEFYGALDVDPGPGTHYLHESKGQNSTSAFVGKYKSNGKFISAFSIIDSGKDYSGTEIKSLATDENDNIYIAGKSYGNVDFDPTDKTAILPSPGGIFFVSYTTDGKLRFLKGIAEHTSSAQEQNYINSIFLDKNTNVYVAGEFSSIDIDCDPGPDSAILVNEHYDGSNNSNTDLFIAKYDSLGNYNYSYDFDGDSSIGYNQSVTIMIDDNGNINYTGYGQTKLNFNTGRKKVYLQPTTESFNLFVAQYKSTDQQLKVNNINNAVANDNASKELKIYPNPITNKFYVELNNVKENNLSATILFVNMRGECLQTVTAIVNNHQLQKEINLSPGILSGNYFIKIIINNSVYYSGVLMKQ